MTDDLFRQISEALDHPDGLEGDLKLQRRLASDEAASDMADEMASIDRTLKSWPLPNRSRAAWASLAGRIEARLDDPVTPIEPDPIEPPVFEGDPAIEERPTPELTVEHVAKTTDTIPSPRPAAMEESGSWPPPPPMPLANLSGEPFRDDLESLPSDFLESEPPPPVESVSGPATPTPPRSTPPTSMPPRSIPPPISRRPSSLPPRTGDRFSLPSVPPTPMSSTTHLDAEASIQAQSHRPARPGQGATWVAAGVTAGAVAVLAFFLVRGSLLDPSRVAMAPSTPEPPVAEIVRGPAPAPEPPSGTAPLEGAGRFERAARRTPDAVPSPREEEEPRDALRAALGGAEDRRAAPPRPEIATRGTSLVGAQRATRSRRQAEPQSASSPSPARAPSPAAPTGETDANAETERAPDDALAEQEPQRRTAAADAVPRSAPETPSREDVLAALQPLTAAVAACGGGARSGVARVAIRFAGSGRVQSAVVEGDFAGTVEGSCAARAVRRARIRPFRQSSFSVTYPFRIP